MAANHPQGATIVRSDERIRALPGPAGTVANVPGLKSAPNQRATKVPKNVLVIEDEVGTLLSMTYMVKSAGHNVLIARDAAEAVETIKSERPDLIVTDINLSVSGQGWDGFGVIEWLNFHFPQHDTKYIMVSSGDPEKLKPRADAIGAFAFLAKPLVKEALLTEIKRAIGDPTEL